MAKKNKPRWERRLMDNRGIFFILAVVFLAIAYGFASLAINYASTWQYVLAIVFLVWGIKEINRGIRSLIHK
jgi:small-conductance mechanosensitive channel